MVFLFNYLHSITVYDRPLIQLPPVNLWTMGRISNHQFIIHKGKEESDNEGKHVQGKFEEHRRLTKSKWYGQRQPKLWGLNLRSLQKDSRMYFRFLTFFFKGKSIFSKVPGIPQKSRSRTSLGWRTIPSTNDLSNKSKRGRLFLDFLAEKSCVIVAPNLGSL